MCHMDTPSTRMWWMRSRDWRAVLLRASKTGSRDAAIAITVCSFFYRFKEPNRHLEAITRLHRHFAVASPIGEHFGDVV